MADLRSNLVPEAMRSINSAGFTNLYQPVGTPLAQPSRVLIFVNNTGVAVTVSWNGTDDAFILLAGNSFVFDENANAVSNATYITPANTQFYVKGVASTGLFYISSFYVT